MNIVIWNINREYKLNWNEIGNISEFENNEIGYRIN